MNKFPSKKIIWLILANTYKAEVYEFIHKSYFLFKVFKHPQSRLKSKELVSDKPGHYKTNHTARGIFVPTADAHEETHKKFSREIADFLEAEREKNRYAGLILCAEPHFYGVLKKMFSKNVQKCVLRIIEKDYIPLPKAKIKEIIEKVIKETHLKTLSS